MTEPGDVHPGHVNGGGSGRAGDDRSSARARSRQRTGQHRLVRAPRHRLLLLSTVVLGVGLVGVLLLNTIISQGAFQQHDLEVRLILVGEQEEALARDVQQAEAPMEVERRARELGMVPAASPVFLNLADGKILGEPIPAPSPTGPVDLSDAPGLHPRPEPSPVLPGAGQAPAFRIPMAPTLPEPLPALPSGAAGHGSTTPSVTPSATGTDPAQAGAAVPSASPAPNPSPSTASGAPAGVAQ